ncbi:MULTISPECIES: alpha-L-fucosidase [unclassified Lentimonas]|uniref:alpha-L-fucosidase n=2 Tax=unclassified Lentimonas TaxID=2630993 RepID=UPI00132A99CC|nr:MULTISPECIES: alpha-L-fucosidase [unclassified Lentimonas]CAA7179906.1 Unannotated [Lentimonas sp. CC8]CAA6677758.1 Unannotated [Lentimonas sp. CC4]CAA6685022.1 Unannotated [Lentimonas sp. CC6]CAA7077860.1 Unannotated [Lentimonas sp. CC4]CAA7169788.1 Unannotated [Lentimonas sp. CC21]
MSYSKFKFIPISIVALMMASSAAILSAKQELTQEEFDYAASAAPKNRKGYAVLPIDPATINVVAGNLGKYEPGFKNGFMNYMSLWMIPKGEGPHLIEWSVEAPAAGAYEVDAIVEGKGAELKLSCNDVQSKVATVVETKWDRVPLGEIALKAGLNTLRLEVAASEAFNFDALELVIPSVKKELLEDAQSMRVEADWLQDAGYGLMFQWTNRATPPTGPIKPWEEKVNDFKLDAFIDMVDASGAAYVLWSVTWGEQYISAPIKSVDKLIAGRTTERDLLGEIADALHERDIKLIFYYHYSYDCNHSIDAEWMEAVGGYKADKTELFDNWMAIVSEIGDRYGDKLHGWWFDGGQRYFNCHFDNTLGNIGIITAPFKELTLASRSGNPERVVAYNSWVKPRLTDYQDYFAGEGMFDAADLEPGSGVLQSGPQKGLMAHRCFVFESRWGHIKRDTPIPEPKYSLERLTRLIKRAQANRAPLSINLEMYEDGSVSPESVALLQQLGDAIRSK